MQYSEDVKALVEELCDPLPLHLEEMWEIAKKHLFNAYRAGYREGCKDSDRLYKTVDSSTPEE